MTERPLTGEMAAAVLERLTQSLRVLGSGALSCSPCGRRGTIGTNDLYDALRVLLAERPQWQPIETAPKDRGFLVGYNARRVEPSGGKSADALDASPRSSTAPARAGDGRMKPYADLRLRAVTIKKALPFVQQVHRRLPKVQGAMWATSVWAGEEMVGVALVGHPAREFMDDDALSVLRVAVCEGYPNACSMLYGACSKAARALGARNLVTYTHMDESGVSLKASGWIEDGLTSGGEHSRPSRPRKAAVDPLPKRRWWAPWSERAKRIA